MLPACDADSADEGTNVFSKPQMIYANPEFPWLWVGDAAGVEQFLRDREWIVPSEQSLRCEKAGEGNMNLTLRISMDQRSVILKQARPWVEKYDHIEAPWDRMRFEQRFYERVASIPAVANRMPRLLHADEQACVVLLEDLAPASDLSSLYVAGRIEESEVDALAEYLCALHGSTRDESLAGFENRGMRILNHTHIFVAPMSDIEGLDLESFEPGLTAIATDLRGDELLRRRIHELGQEYLTDGPCLVHGDFFPGSWIRSSRGLFVIDVEFCHAGWPEHDLGVAIAHLVLAKQPRSAADRLIDAYATRQVVGRQRLAAYVAVEIIRRLIGVAQLPIPMSDGFRADCLDRARRTVTQESMEPLWD